MTQSAYVCSAGMGVGKRRASLHACASRSPSPGPVRHCSEQDRDHITPGYRTTQVIGPDIALSRSNAMSPAQGTRWFASLRTSHPQELRKGNHALSGLFLKNATSQETWSDIRDPPHDQPARSYQPDLRNRNALAAQSFGSGSRLRQSSSDMRTPPPPAAFAL